MTLPVQRLLGIMTITILIEKKNVFKSVSFAEQPLLKTFNSKTMIIISNYTMIEKEKQGVFY